MRIPFTSKRVRKLPAALLALAGALQLPAAIATVGADRALHLTGLLTLLAALTKSLLAVVDDSGADTADAAPADARPSGSPPVDDSGA